MPRFHIPGAVWNPDRLMLDSIESHHAFDVLRMKTGDRATVFDGRGTEAEVELLKRGKSGTDLRRISLHKSPPLKCRITLAQAVPKGKNMELIIEKATELGAAAIVPLLSERTVVRGSEGDHIRKRAKWERVAVEACKQCGQNFLPVVAEPCTPKAFFAQGQRYDLMLIASLQNDSRTFKEVLAECGANRPASVLILVGPEGDFTPAEVALAKSHGCKPVTLGPIILRTETAAIYCVSILNHELQQSRV
jgi:16S rRNA (uracil1498-N3)-methyltransferase